MADAVLVVFSEPAANAEDEYNHWYNNQHLPEVLEIPGFVAAQRYRVTDAQAEGFPAPQRRYLALYDIEGEPGDAINDLLRRVHEGTIVFPPHIEVPSVQAWCYSPITERVTPVTGLTTAASR